MEMTPLMQYLQATIAKSGLDPNTWFYKNLEWLLAWGYVLSKEDVEQIIKELKK